MNDPWSCLETVAGLAAVLAEWRRRAGPAFEGFKAGFLQKAGRDARSIPCPHKAGCWHEVKPRGRGFVGVCKDDDGTGCEDILLTREDVEVWELNRSRLGRAIAWALECERIELRLLVPHTIQIGSYSGAAIPLLLTLPQGRDEFQQVITALVAESGRPFILVGPTNRFVDKRCKELLEKRNAEFCDLASCFELEADGKLKARRPAREMFARFLPDNASRRDGRARPAVRYVFRQAGSVCEVVFEGCAAFHVNNTDGAKYLDYLLHRPNKPIRAFDLEVAIKTDKGQVREQNSAQKVVDERAKREARAELPLLEAELEEAEADGATAKVRRLKEEISKVKAVAGNDGLLDGDAGERARDNVRKAIGKVVKKLRKGGKEEQAFGQHITQFISLGYEVIYNQPEGSAWA